MWFEAYDTILGVICGLAGALLFAKAEPQVFNTDNPRWFASGSVGGLQSGHQLCTVCHVLYEVICTEKSKEEQGWS